MRVVSIIMICFILFIIFQRVDCCYYNRNFLKNLNRSIFKNCNKKALINNGWLLFGLLRPSEQL